MNGFDLIQFILSRNYNFTNFPTLDAPWPMVVMMVSWPSKRECDYVWSVLYKGVQPLQYSNYAWDGISKETYCKESTWYSEDTIPRIISDGGKCGRQSALAEYTRACMGFPAQGVGQPGHRALFYYYHEKAKELADDKTSGPYR